MALPHGPAVGTLAIGLCVCRGTSVILICPEDGMEEIENPFVAEE